MNTRNRTGLKWGIPEILRLQREWELLNLSVEEIAELHGRSQVAIIYKLGSEKFISPIVLDKLLKGEITDRTSTTRSQNKELARLGF